MLPELLDNSGGLVEGHAVPDLDHGRTDHSQGLAPVSGTYSLNQNPP